MEPQLKQIQIRLCVIADQALLLKQKQNSENRDISGQLERIAKVAEQIGGENKGPVITGLLNTIGKIKSYSPEGNFYREIGEPLTIAYESIVGMFELFEKERSQLEPYDIKESPEMTSYKLREILLG